MMRHLRVHKYKSFEGSYCFLSDSSDLAISFQEHQHLNSFFARFPPSPVQDLIKLLSWTMFLSIELGGWWRIYQTYCMSVTDS